MRFSKSVSLSALLVLSACSQKLGSGTSSLSLRLPSAAQLSAHNSKATTASASGVSNVSESKLVAGDLDWSKACFMVNVTGPSINSSPSNKCDAPSGVFMGSAAPGGSLNLSVVSGKSRKIEVFVYFRSSTSDACKPLASLNGYDPGLIASVGSKTVDLLNANESVDIDISLPSVCKTLISEFNLPNYCSANSPSSCAMGEGSSRILPARAFGTTTHLMVDSVVTGLPTGPKRTTASGLMVRFSHELKDRDTQ